MKLFELRSLSFSAVEVGLHFAMIYKAALEYIQKHGIIEISDDGKIYSMTINNYDMANIVNSWPESHRGSMTGEEAISGINIVIQTGELPILTFNGKKIRAAGKYINNTLHIYRFFKAKNKSKFYSIFEKEKIVLLHELCHHFQEANHEPGVDYADQIREIEAGFLENYHNVMLSLYEALSTHDEKVFRNKCILILFYGLSSWYFGGVTASLMVLRRFFISKKTSEILNQYGPHGKVMREIRDMLDYKRRAEGWT